MSLLKFPKMCLDFVLVNVAWMLTVEPLFYYTTSRYSTWVKYTRLVYKYRYSCGYMWVTTSRTYVRNRRDSCVPEDRYFETSGRDLLLSIAQFKPYRGIVYPFNRPGWHFTNSHLTLWCQDSLLQLVHCMLMKKCCNMYPRESFLNIRE